MLSDDGMPCFVKIPLITYVDYKANRFGLLSSIYTIGGLLGSLCAGIVADKRGRRQACLLGALSIGIGATVMSLAPSFTVLVLGRYATNAALPR